MGRQYRDELLKRAGKRREGLASVTSYIRERGAQPINYNRASLGARRGIDLPTETRKILGVKPMDCLSNQGLIT